MTLRFKRIHPDAVLPAYAHQSDAGMDVRSVADVVIPPGGRALVPTGLVAIIPPMYEINTPGTIDSGYRGEIGVILANFGDGDFSVAKGDKVAQLVFAPVTQPEVVETDTIDETDRGAGGFGSTGV